VKNASNINIFWPKNIDFTEQCEDSLHKKRKAAWFLFAQLDIFAHHVLVSLRMWKEDFGHACSFGHQIGKSNSPNIGGSDAGKTASD
jgi:hypothetical protein